MGLVGVYVLAIVVLIGLVIWLTSATEPDDAPRDVHCTGYQGQMTCEYR